MGVTTQNILRIAQERPVLSQGWMKNRRKSAAYMEYVSILRRFFVQDWPKMGVPNYRVNS